jgi:hypothetical protein
MCCAVCNYVVLCPAATPSNGGSASGTAASASTSSSAASSSSHASDALQLHAAVILAQAGLLSTDELKEELDKYLAPMHVDISRLEEAREGSTTKEERDGLDAAISDLLQAVWDATLPACTLLDVLRAPQACWAELRPLLRLVQRRVRSLQLQVIADVGRWCLLHEVLQAVQAMSTAYHVRASLA